MVYGMGGYGGFGPGFYGGYGVPAYGGYGCGGYGYGSGVRWIYALLILIVIVLQFGKRELPCNIAKTDGCFDGTIGCDGQVATGACRNFQSIDNSVLFIIIVFLLAICGGCWQGGGFGCGY